MTDEPVTEWRLHPAYAINWVLPVVFSLPLVLLAWSLWHSGRLTRLSILVLGMAGPLVLGLAARTWWRNHSARVLLTPTEVVTTSRGRTRHVPLAAVAGVVVVLPQRGTWSTWLLLDDEAVELAAPAYAFATRMATLRRPDAAYWATLAASPSGRQAVEIHEAIRQVRGKAHEWGSVAARLEAPPFGWRVQRWWTPDGESSPSLDPDHDR